MKNTTARTSAILRRLIDWHNADAETDTFSQALLMVEIETALQMATALMDHCAERKRAGSYTAADGLQLAAARLDLVMLMEVLKVLGAESHETEDYVIEASALLN
jgi:hypothetical protein